MEYRDSKEEYKFNGLEKNPIHFLEDILNLYGVDVLDISGYSTLTKENKDLYKRFIINFLNDLSLKSRKTIRPLSFNDVEEKKYFGKEDPDEVDLNIILYEIYVIKNDGSKELLKSCEDKENKIKIRKTLKERYLRFEYEIYGKKEFLHVLNDKDWY